MRFHWFYSYKVRMCNGCEKTIERKEGRYIDYREKKYYCRACSGLITMGIEYASEKLKK